MLLPPTPLRAGGRGAVRLTRGPVAAARTLQEELRKAAEKRVEAERRRRHRMQKEQAGSAAVLLEQQLQNAQSKWAAEAKARAASERWLEAELKSKARCPTQERMAGDWERLLTAIGVVLSARLTGRAVARDAGRDGVPVRRAQRPPRGPQGGILQPGRRGGAGAASAAAAPCARRVAAAAQPAADEGAGAGAPVSKVEPPPAQGAAFLLPFSCPLCAHRAIS